MERLIPERETLEIEFKSDIKKLSDTDLIDAIVAFANTNGGDLYLGVEDDGTITGLHKEHKDILQLSAFIANRTIPPVSVRVEMVGSDPDVLMIHVPKSRSIVASSAGKIQRRRLKPDGSPENIPMYPYEINTRLSELSMLDFSSQPVPGAQYSDLDSVERARLRNMIQTYHGETTLLELPDDELDKALQFAVTIDEKLIPTYTGILLIGKKEKLKEYMPTAESAYQMFKGTELLANESFHLPLLAAIEKIISFVEARNSESEMEMGIMRISIPEFDKRAVREAIVNAYAHRDYTRLGRVLVQIDADGLTISNPGGFVEGVTYENILRVEPHGRNPVLADALKRIGLAERSGRGVDRIFEGSLKFGRELPDYSESTSVTVKLLIPRGMPNTQMIALITDHQRKTGELMPINSLLILNALKQGRRMSLLDIAKETHVPEVKTRAALERLTEAGIIEAIGNTKSRTYTLSVRLYKNPADYVRQTDIDQVRHRELVKKLASAKKFITRKDVVELLHISPPQAYRLLKKMVAENELVITGTTSAAKYTLGNSK
ncbi:MAG: putative DNA binding domain-containing protein [Clostridia bacterium]|nr:putative DNA binding domain-containing protein [Clostridia bacterium]